MQHSEYKHDSEFHAHYCSCGEHSETSATRISWLGFLGGLAGIAAMGGLTLAATPVSCLPRCRGSTYKSATVITCERSATH